MEIKDAKYIISSPSVDKCPKPDKPEYAFLGRSNVGKSSLINMLCNKRELAKVSANPGKTQMINHFEITSSPTLLRFAEKGGNKMVPCRSARVWFCCCFSKAKKGVGEDDQ